MATILCRLGSPHHSTHNASVRSFGRQDRSRSNPNPQSSISTLPSMHICTSRATGKDGPRRRRRQQEVCGARLHGAPSGHQALPAVPRSGRRGGLLLLRPGAFGMNEIPFTSHRLPALPTCSRLKPKRRSASSARGRSTRSGTPQPLPLPSGPEWARDITIPTCMAAGVAAYGEVARHADEDLPPLDARRLHFHVSLARVLEVRWKGKVVVVVQ